MKKKLSIIPLIMIVLLIAYPSVCIDGAQRGLKIWSENIVPTLFPFMAVGTMLINSGALKKFAALCSPLTRKIGLSPDASQSLAVGVLSGYPVGAGMTFTLCKQNRISAEEACFTAAVSSFCSPMFIISTVGVKMMQSSAVGLIVLAAHYISFVITLLFFRRFYTAKSKFDAVKCDSHSESKMTFGALLKSSVDSAVKTILTVGGYIVLFSIVIELIAKSSLLPENDYIKCIISGILEMSNGCADIASASLSLSIKIALLCGCVTWGGLCVICQICGFVSECGANCRLLVIFKAVQGVISGIAGFFITKLFAPENSLPTAKLPAQTYSIISVAAVCTIMLAVCFVIPLLIGMKDKKLRR